MKKALFLLMACVITLGLASCEGNSKRDYSYYENDYVAEEVEEVEEVEEEDYGEFIHGGATYVGTKTTDGDYGHWQTTYTIQCFNDGSMKWNEQVKNNGEDSHGHKFEGEWKKKTGSRYDTEYTWYEFWATTYDMYGHSKYSMIGVVDDEGNLYEILIIDDPITLLSIHEPTCELKEQ